MKKIFLIIAVALLSKGGYSQLQIGLDINGENAYDSSGYSVSMPNPTTIAIGAPHNNSLSGHVRVYSWTGGTWLQMGTDIDGWLPSLYSGYSVSMPDEKTLAVGAIYWGPPAHSGCVFVKSWNGSAWVSKGSFMIGGAIAMYAGWSISMPDSNTVAFGCPGGDNPGTDAGFVRVFTWSGSAWVQKGADINGEASGDKSGQSVSMPDANTVAIGAPYNDGSGANAGHVRIYEWGGSAWIQKGADIDGENAGDFSGKSLSMPDPYTVAIGSPYHDELSVDVGQVRIYSWNGTSWVQKGADIEGEFGGDLSGKSVSMPDSKTVAIGAISHMNILTTQFVGQVRIFSWNGTAWVQKGTEMLGDINGGLFGWSVSMPDSSVVAIGAPSCGNQGVGQVRIFDICTTPPPSGSNNQSFCVSATVNDLTASGTNIQWYDAPTGGNILIGSTPLNNGVTYYASQTENNCESQTRLAVSVTINPLPTATVTILGFTLTADQTGASYQWLDCNNANQAIIGETNQSFSPSQSGNYAVEIIKNGCMDTSACMLIVFTGDFENSFLENISVFPNPTEGHVRIDFKNTVENITVSLLSVNGQLIRRARFNNTTLIDFETTDQPGTYLLMISDDKNRHVVFKIAKE